MGNDNQSLIGFANVAGSGTTAAGSASGSARYPHSGIIHHTPHGANHAHFDPMDRSNGNLKKKTKSKSKSKSKSKPSHSQSTTAIQFQKDLASHQKLQREFEYLTKLTNFEENTLRLLHYRFQCIDKSVMEDGCISIHEFANILNMSVSSILLQQFFKFLDKSSIGSLNFRNFALAMNTLDIRTSDNEKIQLSFSFYDTNNDGKIDRTECREMVVLALYEIGIALDANQIDIVVDDTFKMMHPKHEDEIDFEEYQAYCRKYPTTLMPYRVDVKQLVKYEQDHRRGHRYSADTTDNKTLHTFKPFHDGDGKKKFIKKSIKKVKKKFPKMGNARIERVRSIHRIEDICAWDDRDIWDKTDTEFQQIIRQHRRERNRQKHLQKLTRNASIKNKSHSFGLTNASLKLNFGQYQSASVDDNIHLSAINAGNAGDEDEEANHHHNASPANLPTSLTDLTGDDDDDDDTGSESYFSMDSDESFHYNNNNNNNDDEDNNGTLDGKKPESTTMASSGSAIDNQNIHHNGIIADDSARQQNSARDSLKLETKTNSNPVISDTDPVTNSAPVSRKLSLSADNPERQQRKQRKYSDHNNSKTRRHHHHQKQRQPTQLSTKSGSTQKQKQKRKRKHRKKGRRRKRSNSRPKAVNKHENNSQSGGGGGGKRGTASLRCSPRTSPNLLPLSTTARTDSHSQQLASSQSESPLPSGMPGLSLIAKSQENHLTLHNKQLKNARIISLPNTNHHHSHNNINRNQYNNNNNAGNAHKYDNVMEDPQIIPDSNVAVIHSEEEIIDESILSEIEAIISQQSN